MRIYRIEGSFSGPRNPALQRKNPGVPFPEVVDSLIRQFGPVREVYREQTLGILLVFDPAGKFAQDLNDAEAIAQKAAQQETPRTGLRKFPIIENECLSVSQKIDNFAGIRYGDPASMYINWLQLGRTLSADEKLKTDNAYGLQPVTADEYLDRQYEKGTAASARACGKIVTAQLLVNLKIPVSAADVLDQKVRKLLILNGDFGEGFKAFEAFKSIDDVDPTKTLGQ